VPIYGYRCRSCEQDFEVTQRMTDAPQAPCPVCGEAGTRQFFPIGIHFKGSGFYKTDSRTTSATAAPASAGNGQKTSEKTPATADDSGSNGKTKDAAAASPPTPTTPSNTTPPKAASTAD
jgi:putative FmdB family regulatory protein